MYVGRIKSKDTTKVAKNDQKIAELPIKDFNHASSLYVQHATIIAEVKVAYAILIE